MEERLSKKYLYEKLREILDSDEVSSKDKIHAIELGGKFLKLMETRKVIDIRALLAQMSLGELEKVSNARRIEGNSAITVQILDSGSSPSGESGEQLDVSPNSGEAPEHD